MLIKNENAVGILVKTTLIDFPGLVASTIFLPGCNLRCPYCYNAELAKGIVPEKNAVSLNELYEHLKKRKNVISGLVISGGEALLNPHLKEIILTAKAFGYKIKLDTNGTLPKKLEEIISSNDTKPDFIAMDIKTSPLKYEEKNHSGGRPQPCLRKNRRICKNNLKISVRKAGIPDSPCSFNHRKKRH